jgi:Domain of unknown function (DUF4390)
MTGRRIWCGVAVWLAALATLAAWSEVKVTPLVADGKVFASFAAPDAFSDDAREVMRSGLVLTLTYVVELRRPSPFWFDHTLGSVTVASTVKFDTLTAVYQVSKLNEGRVVWSDRTPDQARVRTWMTEFERVPVDVDQPLEPNADYYVRVRVYASPRRTFLLWPWGRDDASGRSSFTFIR